MNINISASFNLLPAEIQLKILSYMKEPEELCKISRVSSLFNELIKDESFWAPILKEHGFKEKGSSKKSSKRLFEIKIKNSNRFIRKKIYIPIFRETSEVITFPKCKTAYSQFKADNEFILKNQKFVSETAGKYLVKDNCKSRLKNLIKRGFIPDVTLLYSAVNEENDTMIYFLMDNWREKFIDDMQKMSDGLQSEKRSEHFWFNLMGEAFIKADKIYKGFKQLNVN